MSIINALIVLECGKSLLSCMIQLIYVTVTVTTQVEQSHSVQ